MIFMTTERLIIRAFKNKDASALFDYLSSPRTPCFQDEKLNSLEDAIKEIDSRILDNSQFAVCLKETDELIGHLFADNKGESDRNTWSVGWHFNKRYEGKGYATESVTALFNICFLKKKPDVFMHMLKTIILPLRNYVLVSICDRRDVLKSLSRSHMIMV
ncbi:Uncharacterised protein [Escherichia coli]|uniref:N-acetyltransferase domain-containing protein n=1 Tax=Escherichia coli TaxID=562 RepID=A0A485JNS0_ECOLX|nr:Uncharacterised protein [Escherichia coli]